MLFNTWLLSLSIQRNYSIILHIDCLLGALPVMDPTAHHYFRHIQNMHDCPILFLSSFYVPFSASLIRQSQHHSDNNH